jgi:nitrogen fixation NifU-like protein
MLSELALAVIQDRTLSGPLEGATNVGTCGEPGEGAYVRIWLKISDGRILAATSATHGCPSSQAASGMAVRLATGRTVEQAMLLTGRDVGLVLGGLPEGKGHFADMAVSALRSALELEG